MATLEISPRVTERLIGEDVIWLTTVRPDLAPVPTPVWFLWSDGSFLLFSEPGTAKLRNVTTSPGVALHLNSDAHGGDVAVFTGKAVIDESGPTAAEWAAYARKYERGFTSIDMPPDEFRQSYSVLVRVTPDRLRAW
ncbi:TIGR03667 family PPOX class F420-dependent oxidoreductase [Rhodococcus gannanensis]|uniref:TIGR03667 family PPOX class F420-dependent oxidoreductase n=1 Tax=Rhodococcus gannanensis TaxID=1960308 RepID=A0ABW4P446_9NOCA